MSLLEASRAGIPAATRRPSLRAAGNRVSAGRTREEPQPSPFFLPSRSVFPRTGVRAQRHTELPLPRQRKKEQRHVSAAVARAAVAARGMTPARRSAEACAIAGITWV